MTHGEHWAAVRLDYADLLDDLLPEVVQLGQLGLRARAPVALDAGNIRTEEVVEFRHGDGPIRFVAYVASDSTLPDAGHEFVTAFPLCWEGEPRLVTVHEASVIPGEVEAVITATGGPGEGPFGFFDPHHFARPDRYTAGSQMTVALAGLAYLLRPASTDSIEITGGELLRLHRARIVEDDPTVDPATITSVSVSMVNAAFMCSRPDRPDDAEFMTRVDRVDEFELLDRRFARVWVSFSRTEEGESLRLPIYASEETLAGYRPAAGDRIEGAMWLQGRPLEE